MALGRQCWSVGAVAAATLLFGAGSALATPITIAGITFAEGANFKTSAIWENTVENPGDILTGIGIVTQIVGGDCGGQCWSDGDNGVELTFTFSYKLEKVTILDADTAEAWFSGGTVTFYSDAAEDFTYGFGGSQAIDEASASNGTEWLNLFGATTGTVCALGECDSADGTIITLQSTFDFGGGDLALVSAGSGAGFFDVVLAGLGLANSYFDTNTQPSGQDIGLDTDFRADETESNFPLTGSASLRSTAARVPEPGTLALLGAGLLGLGWLRRRARS